MEPVQTSIADFGPIEYVMRQSLPRPGVRWERYAVLGYFFVGAMLFALLPFAIVFFLLCLGGLSLFSVLLRASMTRASLESERLRVIDELIRLRRWTEAAAGLRNTMSQPLLSDQHWLTALGHWATLRLRYHEFEPASEILRRMLGEMPARFPHPIFVGPVGVALRIKLASTHLYTDQLVDFDNELSKIRRQIREIENPQEPTATSTSTANELRCELVALELYRDVVTHHPEEAIALYEQSREKLRDTLCHRFAGPMALAAHAYRVQGDRARAGKMFADACLLMPEVELRRLYPALSGELRANESQPGAA